MSPLINLVPGVAQVKWIIAGIVLTMLIGATITFKVQHNKIQTLRSDNTLLTLDVKTLNANAEILRDNYTICAASNKTNLETIAKLTAERQDALNALSAFADQKKKDDRKIAQLRRMLDELNKDPLNNGPVAPVLRETIRAIQKENN